MARIAKDAAFTALKVILLVMCIALPLLSYYEYLTHEENPYDIDIVHIILAAGALFTPIFVLAVLKTAGASFQHNSAYVTAIANSTQNGFIVIDDAGIIQSYNKACEKLFGYTADEILGKHIKMLVPDAYRANHDEYLKEHAQPVNSDIVGTPRELEAQHKNGHVFSIELCAESAKIKGKTIFIGFLRDITKKKIMEDQLRQSQKMEAIGQLTGGVAHDFNNLLSIIFGNIHFINTSLKKDPIDAKQIQDKAHIIQMAANRGAELVKRMMIFSRQQDFEPSTIDLNMLIYDLETLLKRSVGETIDMKIIASGDLWPIKIDPAQMEMAIINIIMNAKDAMPDGGRLILETHNIHINDKFIYRPTNVENGDYVMLSIADNGMGINPENKAKVFDPFFTTKDIGKGTGLGLSAVYGLMQEFNGGVHLYSESGKGSVFRLFIPSLDGASIENKHQGSPPKQSPKGSGGSETILITEDEPEILSLISTYLKNSGYNIMTATNGTDAIKALSNTENKIDLLFTDIAMPGEINGIQLAARAFAINPEIEVLFTTGYSKHNIPDYNLIDEKYDLITKPYNYDDLLVKMREILDKKKHAA